MDFELSPEQQELRASVRSVLAAECPATLVRGVVEGGPPAAGLWARMVELGWPALAIAEADGGLGLGFVELVLVAEELGRVIAPGPLLATASQFAVAVAEAATDEQRRSWLGPVADGERTGTLAIAEDATGWHLDGFATSATRDGDGWQLRGEKRYVADAPTADELVVAATVDDGDRVGLFVVARGDTTVTPLSTMDASRQHATVAFDVRVEPDRVLGTPGGSRDALRRTIEAATVALAAEMVGTCQTLFDQTLDYSKVRQQFDVPIGSFQAIKHKLADMFVALEKARATAYYAAMIIAEDDPRRELATAMAKAAAGDCQRLVAEEAVQIHGGIAYTWEHDLHLFVKRAKSGDAMFGTAADHRAKIADLLQI